MKNWFALFLILLMLSVPVSAKRVSKSNDLLRVFYDNRINEGRDLSISIQVNFNMSYLELMISSENDSFVVYSGTFSGWIPGDYVDDIKVDKNQLVAGAYKGRIVAKYQNTSFPAISLFFSFTVNKVLDDSEIMMASGLILLIFSAPFVYDYDKRKIERKTWNILSFKEYARKRLILAIIAIVAIGGVIYVLQL